MSQLLLRLGCELVGDVQLLGGGLDGSGALLGFTACGCQALLYGDRLRGALAVLSDGILQPHLGHTDAPGIVSLLHAGLAQLVGRGLHVIGEDLEGIAGKALGGCGEGFLELFSELSTAYAAGVFECIFERIAGFIAGRLYLFVDL